MKKFKITKKKILIVVIVVLLLVGFKVMSGSSKVKPVQLKKVSVTNRVVDKTVSASGAVTSVNSADLSFPTTQRLATVVVKKGDVVKKGQFLASLDSRSVAGSVQAAKDARDIVLRQRDLFTNKESDNKKALGGDEQYRIKLRQYDEEVSQSEANYQAALATLNNSYLITPFEGTIVAVDKKEGETAVAGSRIIKIADLNALQFELSIDQEDYGLLKVGQDANISLDSYSNTTFKGKIIELPSYVNSDQSTGFVVKLSLEPMDGKMPLLGMTGDAKMIVSTTGKEVSSLYYDEIFFDEESKPYIWVVENGYVSKLPIEIGLEGDIYTEVKTSTDKQIVAPLTSDTEVRDGYKAQVVK